MGECGMGLEQYYYTTLQEYYLKVESFNDKVYREFDYIRRIQFDIRRGYQCDAKHKPKKLSDVIKLPIDSIIIDAEITYVTQAQKNEMKKRGYILVNPVKE